MTVGYPDPGFRMRSFGPLTSWARLLAASGMAAVVYGCETPERDARAVLRRVRDDAGDLGLDPGRVGLFAASGNAPVGLSLLMGDPGLALRRDDGRGRLDDLSVRGGAGPAGRRRPRSTPTRIA